MPLTAVSGKCASHAPQVSSAAMLAPAECPLKKSRSVLPPNSWMFLNTHVT